jgi:hypothetical protein
MPKRNDPLAAMRARRQISVAQYRAGRACQKLHKQGATAALARCSAALGRDGTALVEAVLARGMSVTAAAADRGYGTGRSVAYVGQRLRECLETLAREFGYA